MTRRGRDVLLDTGPLVALLDRRDAWHARCLAAWPLLAARCVTTEAVVTEATYLVSRGGGPPSVVLELLLAGETPILGLDTEGHRHAAWLMRQYTDTPMDYADATLVVAARALRTNRIFTLDRRGFAAYRDARTGAFEIIPSA